MVVVAVELARNGGRSRRRRGDDNTNISHHSKSNDKATSELLPLLP